MLAPGLAVLQGSPLGLTCASPLIIDHSHLVFVTRYGVKTSGNLPAPRIVRVFRPTADRWSYFFRHYEVAESRETL